jgi:hypothetical protein
VAAHDVRRLRRVVLAVLAIEAVAIALGVGFALPAQFGGGRDADAVGSEWLTNGTAISAPIFPLVAFALGALLAGARRAPLACAGLVLVALGAVALAVGSLGEAFAPDTPDVPRAVLIASGVVGCALALALLGACAFALRSYLKHDVTAVAGAHPAGVTDEQR